jgi:hypothetical protein
MRAQRSTSASFITRPIKHRYPKMTGTECGAYILYGVTSTSFPYTFLRGLKVLMSTARSFLKAMKYGSKFTYQTVPRLLMIWMDMGEDPKSAKTETFNKICIEVTRGIPDIPAYKVSVSHFSGEGKILMA